MIDDVVLVSRREIVLPSDDVRPARRTRKRTDLRRPESSRVLREGAIERVGEDVVAVTGDCDPFELEEKQG